MGLPDADKLHFMLAVKGEVAAGGAGVVPTWNVFHYRRTAVPSPNIAGELTTAFHTLVKTAWKACISNDWSWTSTFERCISDPTDAGLVTTVGETGSIVEEALPAHNNVCVHLLSGLRGRSYRGRKMFAGVGESLVAQNVLAAGGIALFDTLRALLDDTVVDASGNTYVPEIISMTNPLTDLTVSPAVIMAVDVISTELQERLGLMRGRRST